MGWRINGVFYLLLCLGFGFSGTAHGQSQEGQQLLLNVEKLGQLKNILRDMKRGYQVLSGGYNTVRDIAKGNFSLHELFLDGLYLVSPEVRKYRRVGEVIAMQGRLVKEFRSGFAGFRVSGLFVEGELAYMERVYGNLLSGSMDGLEELAMVVTSSKLRMDDGERLRAVDRIFAGMEERLAFLREFNLQALELQGQRERERSDLAGMGRLMGIGR